MELAALGCCPCPGLHSGGLEQGAFRTRGPGGELAASVRALDLHQTEGSSGSQAQDSSQVSSLSPLHSQGAPQLLALAV